MHAEDPNDAPPPEDEETLPCEDEETLPCEDESALFALDIERYRQ